MPKGAQLTVEANAYDVANIVADIMRKANIKPDTAVTEARTKIRDGMQAVKDYKGVTGTVTMKPDGDATFPATVVIAKNRRRETYK